MDLRLWFLAESEWLRLLSLEDRRYRETARDLVWLAAWHDEITASVLSPTSYEKRKVAERWL